MDQEGKDEGLLRKYLLGELNEADEQAFEERLLADDELSELVLAEEDELVDDYVGGELSEAERARFESHFMVTPERRKKLKFGEALRRHEVRVFKQVESPASNDPGRDRASEAGPNTPKAQDPGANESPSSVASAVLDPRFTVVSGPSSWWSRALSIPYLRMAAAVLIVFALGFVAWRLFFFQSFDSRIALLLNDVCREQRTIETRPSGVDYGPLIETRGGEITDQPTLNRAQRIALDEVDENPGPASFHALGRVYLVERRFKDAIDQFEKALPGAQENARLHSDLGAALLEKARLNEDNTEKASEMVRSRSHIDRAIELKGELLEPLFNRAVWYESMFLPREAQASWEKYLEKDPHSKWAEEARQRLMSLRERERSSQEIDKPFQKFLVAYQNSDNKAAWSAFSRARERTGNSIAEGLIDDYLNFTEAGKNHEAQSELAILKYAGDLDDEKANDSFTRNLARFYASIGRGQRTQVARARDLVKSANESYQQTEFERAIEFYAKAQSAFAESGDSCEDVFAEFRMGTCFLRVKPDRSISIFERLASVCKTKGYKWLLAQSLNGLSDAQSSKRNFSKTLEYADDSLRISQEIDDPRGVLRNMQLPVAMHQQFGEYTKSLGLTLRALDFASTFSPTPQEIWTFYHQAGFNLYSMNLPRIALDFQTEALRLAMDSGEPLLKSRSHALLGLIHQSLRRFDLAIDSCQSALAEGQRIEGEDSRNNVIANSTLNLAHVYRESGDFQRAAACYDDALQLHKKLDLDIYLFQAHKGKLLTLMGLGDDSATNEEIKIATRLIEQYRPKIQEESNRIAFFDLAQSTYDAAIDFSYSQLKNPMEAFGYAENSRSRSLLDLLGSPAQVMNHSGIPDLKISSVSQPRGLGDIKQYLPDGAQILQYSVLDDRVVMWVISNISVDSRDQEVPAAKLTEEVRSFLETILRKHPNDGQALVLAKDLYSLLITPVEPLLDKQNTIYIVPDKILNYLPFGALVGADNRYFIQDHAFGLSPSSSVFLSCSEVALAKQNITEETILSVGNPTFDRSLFPTLSDLPSAALEARKISKLYNSAFLFTNDVATETRIKREMVRANVMHFASHYVIEESPMKSKLLLAKESVTTNERQKDDGFLEVSEIYRMNLPNTRLAVLAACQTGIERSFRGEGAIGMARPFIRAGVPIVVASLWPVETKATAELMVGFHRYRKEGHSTVEALRNAQIDMIESADSAHRLPQFWASFVMIGGHATF